MRGFKLFVTRVKYRQLVSNYCFSSCPGNFFDSIGKPKFVSAPMVDHSDLPFRLLVRQGGVELAFTEMLSSKRIVADSKYRRDVCDWMVYANEPEKDSPIIAQLNGNDPDTLVQAGLLIQDTVTAIDLNLGCPQNIAKRGNYGAYLLQDQEHVIRILSCMTSSLRCPVTAKIRIFQNINDTITLCKQIESIGVELITVHGRTVDQKKQFVGSVNWDAIRQVKEAVSIPVIANGGVSTRADALACLEATGADAVMSSEALLENPRLFSEAGDHDFRRSYTKSQLQVVREYLRLVEAHNFHKQPKIVRGHLFKMLFRYISAERNHDLRNKLGICDYNGMREIVEEIEDRMKALDFNEEVVVREGFLSSRTWYNRFV